jgi:hypothetical protein
MSDDFISGLKEQYGEPGEDNSHPMAPWGGGLLQEGLEAGKKGVEYGGAFARGALKSAAQAPGLSAILPQGITDWSKEVDPAHPNVEGAGRYLSPSTAALAYLPDAPFLAAAKTAPWLVRAGSSVAQNAWKNAVGGAVESDTNTKTPEEAASNAGRGALEGMGTGAALTGAQIGLDAVPRHLLPVAIAAAQLAHGGHYLWHDVRRAAAHGLHWLAQQSKRAPAGLVGAAGEAGAKEKGYEPGGSAPQDSSDPF